jgi:hypothetical protein
MRRSISISLVCLVLGWARPATAGPPAESAPAEPAPVPTLVEPASEPEELPRYDVPIVVEEPAEAKPSVDGEIPVMIAVGSVLLGGGIIGGVTTVVEWQSEYSTNLTFLLNPELPPILLGVCLTGVVTGATLVGVGIAKHERWKASLKRGTARVQLRPTFGFAQIGVAGRF